jgi:hypothetical protein
MNLLENKLVQAALVVGVLMFLLNTFNEQSVESLEQDALEAEAQGKLEDVESKITLDVTNAISESPKLQAASISGLKNTDSVPATSQASTGSSGDLSAEDLLPIHDTSSDFASRHPSGVGALSGKNFLTSGYHVGINTVGTSLRNANLGIRSEPANPIQHVSPWNNTTITPDVNRLPLEIGSQ